MNTRTSTREHDTPVGTSNLAANAAAARMARSAAPRPASEAASGRHELEVNPLWMITGGLAAFLLIVVAIG